MLFMVWLICLKVKIGLFVRKVFTILEAPIYEMSLILEDKLRTKIAG